LSILPPSPVNTDAASLLSDALGSTQRILVLGASGWFGRTLLSMMSGAGRELLLVGSKERDILVAHQEFHIQEWSHSFLSEFNPELVFDFAFLTRDQELLLGPTEFNRVNAMLTERLKAVSEFPSVKKLLTVSSGATKVPKFSQSGTGPDSYGQQKAAVEELLTDASTQSGLEVVVARAWSVSGGFVQKPHNYAFSDFVASGIRDRVVRVNAPHLVRRRYCSVEDFLAVSFSGGADQSFYELDSAGELVELEELANLVARELGGIPVEVKHFDRSSSIPDDYFSDGIEWSSAVRKLNFAPTDLSTQVRNVIAALS
jgi:nucleoside-diphosphate-sugar epimerase